MPGTKYVKLIHIPIHPSISRLRISRSPVIHPISSEVGNLMLPKEEATECADVKNLHVNNHYVARNYSTLLLYCDQNARKHKR